LRHQLKADFTFRIARKFYKASDSLVKSGETEAMLQLYDEEPPYRAAICGLLSGGNEVFLTSLVDQNLVS
jgi:hypothetical protein